MDSKRMEGQLRFLIEIDKMKSVLRQTLLADGSHRENDAEHSWHLALYAMILQEYAAGEIDIDRVVQMVLVHDLVEIYAGDTFCYDAAANTDKAERENAAAEKLFSLLEPEQGAYYEALWREFDAEETDDSKYAAAMDRIQPLMNNYMTGGHTWHLGIFTAVMCIGVWHRSKSGRRNSGRSLNILWKTAYKKDICQNDKNTNPSTPFEGFLF